MRRLQSYWHRRSPAAKLAAAYVVIIMIISVVFSVVLYGFASAQLAEGLRHQYLRIYSFRPSSQLLRPGPAQFHGELDTARQALLLQLLYFNALILVAASALSYWLAKRTLRPIEESLESQSRFTGDASHELRTPLTAMQTEIEVALRREKTTSKQEALALLRSILEEVGKLKALSNGLLQLANGGNHTNMQPVGLGEIAAEAVQRASKTANGKKITITNNVSDLEVLGDRDSLIQLLAILLDNAIKYSGSGTSITITSEKQGRYAQLVVADEGLGIAAADLPHIFDRFYRADKSRSKDMASGYGLGLSIAQKLAHVHGGNIEVRSELSKGSKFIVRLPLV